MAKAELTIREQGDRIAIGHVLARCFALAGLSQKEVAGLVDRDHAQVARWVSGAERPPFDRLFAVLALRQPLVIAFAEYVGTGVDVVTEIRLRKTA